MREASYYKKLDTEKVQCQLCPWNCVILEEKSGSCRARKNISGRLMSLVYAKPVNIAIDPIEKKPLFHFMPGNTILSLGTFGCNLSCMGCQNSDISKEWHEDEIRSDRVMPEKIIELCKKNACSMIAFTYNEPTMFFEYMLDIAKLAKKEKIKTVMVTNGYINQEPLLELIKYIDAANIDLKGFSEKFYQEWTKGRMQPVLDTIKTMKNNGVWIELTTLVIPDTNDDPKEINAMCSWIKDAVGSDVPLHFSRFFPMYKAQDKQTTPIRTLTELKKIADTYLHHVYVGNVIESTFENTLCPKCKKTVIERSGFSIVNNSLTNGKCSCGQLIAGIWG